MPLPSSSIIIDEQDSLTPLQITFLLARQIPSGASFQTIMREFAVATPITPYSKKFTVQKIEKWSNLRNVGFYEVHDDEVLDDTEILTLMDLKDSHMYLVVGEEGIVPSGALQESVAEEQAPHAEKRPITDQEREIFSLLTAETANHSIEFYFELEGYNINRAVLQYFDLDARDRFLNRGIRYRDGLWAEIKRSVSVVQYDGPQFVEPLTKATLLSAQLLDAAFQDNFDRFVALYNFQDDSGVQPPLKIDRSVRDSAGRHVLHYASSERTANFILKHDPSLFDIIDNDGFTPLAHAIIRNNSALVKLYLQHYFTKPPTVPLSAHSPVALLHLAVQQAAPELCIYLVREAHADLLEISASMTPFYWACLLQRDHVVRALLDTYGADKVGLNLPMGEQGLTPLIAQVVRGNTRMAKYFVEKGAFIDYVDSQDRTVLSYAVLRRNDELGVLLVEKGVKALFSMHGDPVTPEELHLRGLPRTAEALAKRNGDMIPPAHNVQETNGVQPMEDVEEGTPATPLQLFFRAIEALDFDTVRSMCMNNPALVNEQSPADLQTALHVAVESESYVIVKFLLEHSAYTDAGNFFGTTPTHIAQRLKYAQILDLLKTKGADLKAQDLTSSSVLNSHEHSLNNWIYTLTEIDYDDSQEGSAECKYWMPGTGSRLYADIIFLNEEHAAQRKPCVERIMTLNRVLPSVLSTGIIECCRTMRAINVSANCMCVFYHQEEGVSYHNFVDYFATKTDATSSLKKELQLEKKLELMCKLTLLMCTLHRSRISHGNICSSSVKVARTKGGHQEVVLFNYNLFNNKTQAEEVRDFGLLLFEAFYGKEWTPDIEAVQSSKEGQELVMIVDSCLHPEPELRPDFLSLYNQVSKARHTLYESRIERYKQLTPQIAQSGNTAELKALHLLITKEESGMDVAKNEQLFMDSSLRQFDYSRALTSAFTFDQWAVDPEKVFGRIETAVIQKHALSLDSDENVDFSNLRAYISAGYKGNPTQLKNSNRVYSLISKVVLNVPVEDQFPLLDVLRVMMCDEAVARELLTKETTILNTVFSEQICSSWHSQSVPYKLMALRLACNMCKWNDGLNWWYGRLKMALRIINESWKEEKAPVRLAAAALALNLASYFPEELRFTKAFCKITWASLTQEISKLDKNSTEQKEIVERSATAMYNVLRRSGAAREEAKKLPNTEATLKTLSKMDVEYSLVKSLAACLLNDKEYVSFTMEY